MNRTVLVTGAARGIGRAVAEKFARSGDHIMLHYANSDGAAEKALRALEGTGHHLISGDLRIPKEAEKIVAATVDAHGRLDILVNCAAAPMVPHPIASVDYGAWQDAWKATLDVNLVGAANITFCVAQQMIKQGDGGRIINIGSRGAFRGEPDHPAYGASKAALHSLGQSLAVSLAPHKIAVTSVAPGFVATERNEARLNGPEGASIAGQSPTGRVASAHEVAAAVHFLASADAMWATGAILDLNGASYLRT